MLHVMVPVQFDAVNVALSVPHTSVLFAVMLGAFGGVPVVIVIVFELPLSPQLFVQTALYVPVPTLIVAVVAPVLHLIVPVQFAAVKVALSVPQITVLSAVMLGAFGGLPVVIVIVFDTGLTPHSVLQVAVYVPACVTVIESPVSVVLQITIPLQFAALSIADSLCIIQFYWQLLLA
jgi:hypothetical protein